MNCRSRPATKVQITPRTLNRFLYPAHPVPLTMTAADKGFRTFIDNVGSRLETISLLVPFWEQIQQIILTVYPDGPSLSTDVV